MQSDGAARCGESQTLSPQPIFFDDYALRSTPTHHHPMLLSHHGHPGWRKPCRLPPPVPLHNSEMRLSAHPGHDRGSGGGRNVFTPWPPHKFSTPSCRCLVVSRHLFDRLLCVSCSGLPCLPGTSFSPTATQRSVMILPPVWNSSFLSSPLDACDPSGRPCHGVCRDSLCEIMRGQIDHHKDVSSRPS